MIPYRDVLPQLRRWPEWNQGVQLLARFKTLLTNDVSDYLAKIPREWLAIDRHAFVLDILERRLERLETML